MREVQPDTITDIGNVSATDVRAALIAATRRGFRACNARPDGVALGGAAVTFADEAIIIQGGETWNEGEALGAGWSVICDAGNTAELYVLEISE